MLLYLRKKKMFLFKYRKRFWNPFDEVKAFLNICLSSKLQYNIQIRTFISTKEGQMWAYPSKCSPWEQKAKYTVILGTIRTSEVQGA